MGDCLRTHVLVTSRLHRRGTVRARSYRYRSHGPGTPSPGSISRTWRRSPRVRTARNVIPIGVLSSIRTRCRLTWSCAASLLSTLSACTGRRPASARRSGGLDGAGPGRRPREPRGGAVTRTLREIAGPFVAAAPVGARVRTRLRVSAEDEAVLRAAGSHLGSLAGRDLAARCAEGRLDARGKAVSRRERKRALTAESSSRWAGAITRTSEQHPPPLSD
jgi:hypothetical protein